MGLLISIKNIYLFIVFGYEPVHETLARLWSLNLSLETPSDVQSVAYNTHGIFKRLAKTLIRLRICAG